MILLSPERQRQSELVSSHTAANNNSAASSTSINATPTPLQVYPSTRTYELVSEMITLTGYQTYIVEQWVPDRSRIFKTTTVYTGDKRHQILVAAVRIEPEERSSHGAETHDVYSRLMNQFEVDKARPVVTPQGTVMVTSLGSFSSHLNIILVPDGDYEHHIAAFTLNLNLRRLGCSGRSALGIQQPNDVQRQRFIQVYKATDMIDLNVAVTVMVKLVQCSLSILGYIEPFDCDGVLCDTTLSAFRLYSEDFGPFEISEAQSTIGYPVLFAHLLGKVISYRLRLLALGFHQCPKNPFEDIDGFLATLSAFQKSLKIELTGYLDNVTMDKLKEQYQRVAPTASKTAKYGHVRVEEIQSLNLESLAKTVNMDVFKIVWGGKTKQLTGDVILESANFAEGIIQGGKESAKNFLRNVSNKTPRMLEFNKDRGQNVMRGLRDGVAGTMSRFSTSVEGFVDRRRHASRSPRRHRRRSFGRRRSSDQMTDRAGSNLIDSDLSTNSDEESSPGSRRGPDACNRGVRKSFSEADLKNDKKSVDKARRNTCSFAPFEEYEVTILAEKDNSAQVEELWKYELELEESVQNIKKISAEYAHKLQTLSEIYVNHWQGFASMESDLNAMMDDFKQMQVQIDGLDSKVSKQQYEVSALEEKWKETKDVVTNFDNQIAAMDRQVVAGLKTLSAFDLTYILKSLYNYVMTGNI